VKAERCVAPIILPVRIASALVIAHVQVSRSLTLGCFRRYSVDSGRVCFDSNATTDSRHTFSATVSRSIVRDTRGPREAARRAARFREKQSRVRDEDEETIVIEQLDKNYRRKRIGRRGRGGSGGYSVVVVVVIGNHAKTIQIRSLLSIESAERSILVREDGSCQKCGVASKGKRDMVYGGGFDMVETVSFRFVSYIFYSILFLQFISHMFRRST